MTRPHLGTSMPRLTNGPGPPCSAQHRIPQQPLDWQYRIDKVRHVFKHHLHCRLWDWSLRVLQIRRQSSCARSARGSSCPAKSTNFARGRQLELRG